MNVGISYREHGLYRDDVSRVAELPLPWKKLEGKSVLLTGASGQVGTFLIDVIAYRNANHGMNCRVIALGRDRVKACERFGSVMDEPWFEFFPWDITVPFEGGMFSHLDYLLHLASPTHPMDYATRPIDTIAVNVIGLKNLLDLAAGSHTARTLFASSVEIYGENRGDVTSFSETYNGYLDCNTLRSGYPEAKRCGESLCQAYRAEKGIEAVIIRLPRIYGPGVLPEDSKAISQFMRMAKAKENVVLKSGGEQKYSFLYVADAISALLFVLLKGKDGEAYNAANILSDISLKDLATMIAEMTDVRVVNDMPDEVEKRGYSKATLAVLDGTKIGELGWRAAYDIKEGVKRTLSIR